MHLKLLTMQQKRTAKTKHSQHSIEKAVLVSAAFFCFLFLHCAHLMPLNESNT